MCILLIYSVLAITDAINSNHQMHNLYANFVNILEECKIYSEDLENHLGNMSKCSLSPRSVHSLLLENLGYDSESYSHGLKSGVVVECPAETATPRRGPTAFDKIDVDYC